MARVCKGECMQHRLGDDLDKMAQLWVVTAIQSLWVETCLWPSLQLKGYKGKNLFLFFSFLSFDSLYSSSFHGRICANPAVLCNK